MRHEPTITVLWLCRQVSPRANSKKLESKGETTRRHMSSPADLLAPECGVAAALLFGVLYNFLGVGAHSSTRSFLRLPLALAAPCVVAIASGGKDIILSA